MAPKFAIKRQDTNALVTIIQQIEVVAMLFDDVIREHYSTSDADDEDASELKEAQTQLRSIEFSVGELVGKQLTEEVQDDTNTDNFRFD
jgi:hypothetical protein